MVNPSEMMQTLRNSFNSGKTKPMEFRLKQLKALLRLYEENSYDILQALATDLHKSKQEAEGMETQYLINELENTIRNLKSWVKPERPPKALVNLFDSLYIYNDPYGVVLVMGAWNYPIHLTLLPVAGAIAAGNCVVIKPSEVTIASAKFIAETIPKYLDSDCYQVFEGGIHLLLERFDYIFCTGSTSSGQIVHAAANKNLTPVTLILEGKNPVYLDNTVDIKVATKRILWGKCVNAGQTNVAPEYLLCTEDVRDKFVQCAREVLKEFYGDNPKKSPDLGRIVDDQQFQRLIGLLQNHKPAIGGCFDASERYIEPTILTDVKFDDGVMQEVIRGPVLPIITINDVHDALIFINSLEKPLAFYIFSNRKKDVQFLIENTSSGGVLVNDTIMHKVNDMPYGGVGLSGMGNFHGKYTFDTFSHKRSCLYKTFGVIGEKLGSVRYPPYSEEKLILLNLWLKRWPSLKRVYLDYSFMFSVGVMTVLGYQYIVENMDNMFE